MSTHWVQQVFFKRNYVYETSEISPAEAKQFIVAINYLSKRSRWTFHSTLIVGKSVTEAEPPLRFDTKPVIVGTGQINIKQTYTTLLLGHT